jgi:hypothetical protein
MGRRAIQNGFLGKPGGKKPLGKSRYKWEYNFRLGNEEEKWEGLDWISLAQESFKWWALVHTSSIK